MNRPAILLFLLLFLMIPVSTAAEITFTATQKDYYVLAGEEARIVLGVANGYGRDIPGTLSEYQTAGTTMTNTQSTDIRYSSSKKVTIFQDMKQLTLSPLKSTEPADISIRVVFRYQEEDSRSATLEGIQVHFVNAPEEKQDQPFQQRSVDAPDPITGASKTAVPGAAPPSGTGQQGTGQSLTRTLTTGQTGQDTLALKEAITRESQEHADQREELTTCLEGDPLFGQVQQSMQEQGYMAGTRDILPVNGTSGNCITQYQSSSGTVATLSATITGGSVERMEISSGDKNLLPAVLVNNETFQGFRKGIEDNGGQFSHFQQTVTPAGTKADIIYQAPGGGTSHIRGLIAEEKVLSVTLEEPFDLMAWIVPLLTGGFIIALSVVGVIILRKRKKKGDPLVSSPSALIVLHHRALAEAALADASARAERGEYPGAFAEASRALRIFIAGEFSTGEELTGSEALDKVPADRRRVTNLSYLFHRCNLVTYGGRPPDSGEINAIIASIREFIESVGHSGDGTR